MASIEKPTLLKLSRQLWSILRDLEAYEDCVAECLKEDYWINEEFFDEEEIIEYGIEIAEDVLEAKKTAIGIFDSSAEKASSVLDKLSQCLERALRNAELHRTFEGLHGKIAYSEKWEPPRVCLLKDIFRTDKVWFDVMEKIAQETAGAYAENQFDSGKIEADGIDLIHSEHKSAPLSLTQMATYWGGQITPKKLKSMIKNGNLKVEQINRQTFVFDTETLPDYVRNKVRK